jgi:hypothetical protein
LVELRQNGTLRGYAAISISEGEQNRILAIREICADGKDAFSKLIDLIIRRGLEENVDFIIWRRCQESFEDILLEKDALTFAETMIMVALMNPREFLKPLSDRVEKGAVAKLDIEGLGSVSLRIGRDEFAVQEEESSTDFAISLDGPTFMRLFLGRASFFREWIRRNIKVSLIHYRMANRLFKMVRNTKWYVPSGDWC